MMKKLEIFEPAMCCPTGLCGVAVDPELLRISTLMDTLTAHGIDAHRYNLTSNPMAFVDNALIAQLLQETGTDSLPVVLLDGKVMCQGRYPSNGELEGFLLLPMGTLAPKAQGGCCCKGGCC